MATEMYTKSQREMADLLVKRSRTWTRGTRKIDGLAFVIFPSSRSDVNGRKAYYSTESACSCPGYQNRGRCSHVLAVQTEAEAARERFCRPTYSRGYRDLFPADEYDRPLVDAF